ncbi:tetratricopeptide repeat protein [Limnohabitans sp. JirII-31]|uniref:tetratricopeptide repeat protein n=1 Tax=Limnohabitans sp. JirII-31 TaxID=1977908 RepID=UPI0013043C47|nr:tetratricopeptide repeat protein [Limnohabitans sp. JirII-31]
MSVEIDKQFTQGLALHQQGKLAQSKVLYEAVLKANPRHFDALHLLGVVEMSLGNSDAAVNLISSALKEKKNATDAYYNLGLALDAANRKEQAIKAYDDCLRLNPKNFSALNNKSKSQRDIGKYQEAIVSSNTAIAIKPDYAAAYFNRALALTELKQWDAALDSYNKAISIKPDYAEAYFSRGSVLKEVRRMNEALDSYEIGVNLKPDFEYSFGTLLHLKMITCDWEDFQSNVFKLIENLRKNKRSSPSFPVLALIDSLPMHYKASEIWVNDKHPPNSSLGAIGKLKCKEKIRIGYYSADFFNHATSYLMAELFELHNRAKFELIGFSFGPNEQDEMQQRVSAAFDSFIRVDHKTDKEIASMSRGMGIDIAIDLKGFTHGCRTGIFAYRAAPIQVNYIGYPGTMAADYIDYLIADPTLIPIKNQKFYSEKIVYLPDSYQVNDRHRVISDKTMTRHELGLPKDSFVFCCFNNNYKITPDTFDGWIRILNAVEGSVLWLLESNHSAGINLRKEASHRGLDPNRLIFAKRMKLPEHLARHKAADLFIDTFPCNAHTTASDALWAGLPVLTCMGESFASRVSASLLNAIELPELITSTQEQFEAMAIDLATHPTKLKAIKHKLERNRLTTALFDTPRFCKHIESAYTAMYERYQADLAPDHIYIQPQGSI